MLYLSKSKYCSAVQCPKMLWLKMYKPELFDDGVMNQAVLSTGNEVGDLAMGLFGEYVEVPFGDLGEMITKTERLLCEGTPIIAEASFSYEGCFCSVDLLKNLGDGQLELYEVKSSTSVHEIYRHDVAYQTWVLTKLGYSVQRVCLVHINNQYIRCGELDLQQLFAIEDLTESTMQELNAVESRIEQLKTYLQQADEPTDDIGAHCFSPYDCGFWGHCACHLPQPNVFDLAGVSLQKKVACYRDGLCSYEALNQYGKLPAKTYQQIEHTLCDLPPYIDRESIRTMMQKLSYPLYFLDFESFQPAVPLYENSRPFQQIVFQYSLHYIEHEGGELKHKEFLAQPGEDPRRALAQQLCRDIPIDACTTAYNMAFEKTRIKELAQIYPDLAAHLMNIHDHIQDLMVPFQKRWYYTAAMHGSYSIKYVLPALYPDDPTLDYHNLEGVHNGGEASATFAAMEQMSAEERQAARENLLRYCKLDTYAMVKVWQTLRQI